MSLNFVLCVLLAMVGMAFGEGLRVGVFDVDAGPAPGANLAYVPFLENDVVGVRARGVILEGGDEKGALVLCAVDWIGIAHESYEDLRVSLAKAAETTVDRVALHSLHQHDSMRRDRTAEGLLKGAGREAKGIASEGTDAAVERLVAAVEKTWKKGMRKWTHVSAGVADVEKVASNRRILGKDGKVEGIRFSATKSEKLRAAPEGVIDPRVVVLGLWDEDEVVGVLSYYATHPQSYYRVGIASPDFPGWARLIREVETDGVLHVYFTGAAGNVAAGKYNDGSVPMRAVLAKRLADGMRKAWEAAEKFPITAESFGWEVDPVELPVSEKLKGKEAEFEAILKDDSAGSEAWYWAARRLAWLRQSAAGTKYDIGCLRLGKVRVLHLPGEPFVEYQLAAVEMRKDLLVTMAGYGNNGASYMGLAHSYEEGGYETSDRIALVAPEVEEVLMGAIRRLLLP